MKRKQRIYRPEQPVKVEFLNDFIVVTLADGRVVRRPLQDFPWLNRALPEQRNHYELDPFSIYWPDWDDGIDIDWLLEQPARQPQYAASQSIVRLLSFPDARAISAIHYKISDTEGETVVSRKPEDHFSRIRQA